MTLKKYIWSPLHKWGALVFGVLIMLICATGAILSFEKELLPQTIRSIYYHNVSDGQQSLKLDEIFYKLNNSDGRVIKTVTLPADASRNWVITYADAPQTEVFINPYSGEVAGVFTYKNSFFSTVRELHRFLLIGKTGRLITGSVSFIFAAILISGLFLNLPVSLRKLRNCFVLDWRGNRYRKTFRLHIVLGWYTALFLLVMALTGPFWSFGWYNGMLSSVFGIERTVSRRDRAEALEQPLKTLTPEYLAQVDNKLRVLESVHTGYKELRFTVPEVADTSFTITLVPTSQIHSRQTDLFTYRLSDGVLQKESLFKTKPLQETFRMWVFAIHTGAWGGWVGKLLYFVAALSGVILPVTGYLLWWYKKNNAKRKQL